MHAVTYRATIGSALGLYVIGGFFVIGFGLAGQLAAGWAVFLWLVAIRVRCRVKVSDQQLDVTTLLGEAHMRWSEIVRVRHANSGGYWASRFYGPAVLEFTSPSSRLCINFKLFPRDCYQEVLRHIPAGARSC